MEPDGPRRRPAQRRRGVDGGLPDDHPGGCRARSGRRLRRFGAGRIDRDGTVRRPGGAVQGAAGCSATRPAHRAGTARPRLGGGDRQHRGDRRRPAGRGSRRVGLAVGGGSSRRRAAGADLRDRRASQGAVRAPAAHPASGSGGSLRARLRRLHLPARRCLVPDHDVAALSAAGRAAVHHHCPEQRAGRRPGRPDRRARRRGAGNRRSRLADRAVVEGRVLCQRVLGKRGAGPVPTPHAHLSRPW